MTNLIETYVVKVEINHCQGNSTVLGGFYDLRADSVKWLMADLPALLEARATDWKAESGGIKITFTNTGLEEVPEETGGDN
jgi:hypothetical protein